MATKISGIKGINISKSSVLRDGSKKTNTNDSFRDTANGTTRDNSKNNNQSSLDAAMIKMLLGQTELMAKKTQEIEANMRRAEKKEEERRKQKENADREREVKREKAEREKTDKKFDKAYDSLDAGLINGILSGILGPGAVMLGKGLSATLGGYARPARRAAVRGVGKAFSSIGSIWGKKSKKDKEKDSKEESESAISVNKREMAAEPVNHLRTSVTKRLDEIIKLMGGTPRGGIGDGENKKGLLDWLLPFLPLLAGMVSGYQPLKDFGTKFLLKRLRKILDPMIEFGVKLAKKGWNLVKNPLKKAGAKIIKWLKGPLSKGAKFLSGGLKKLGSKIMSSGIGKALKSVAKSISKSGLVQGLKTLAKSVTNTAGKLLKPVGKILSKAAKPLMKVGGKLLKPIAKAGSKIISKVGAKGGMKALGKSLLKKIPGVSVLSGLWFGAKRAMKGDWTGAAMELGSGILGTIPIVGTALSTAADVAILARDIKNDISAEKQSNQQVSTEGNYNTEAPTNYDYDMYQENNATTSAILDVLNQIEYNLRPEVQQHLDTVYLNNARTMFDRPPEAPQYDFGLNGITQTELNPLGVR